MVTYFPFLPASDGQKVNFIAAVPSTKKMDN